MNTTNSLAGKPATPISVTAFVDWNAQMHNAGVQPETDAKQRAQRAFAQTARLVCKALAAEEAWFRVSFRLYHGWYKGWEATEHLKAAIYAVENENVPAPSSSRISFARTVEYGHTLLSALPERRHQSPPVHLANTLRQQGKGRPLKEKMVDTALAADLLAWARFQSKEWALVLAEDDDLIPPLYTAEAWVRQRGGRALLVRRRGANQYVKLQGLLRQVQ